jgi:hypothetical protein
MAQGSLNPYTREGLLPRVKYVARGSLLRAVVAVTGNDVPGPHRKDNTARRTLGHPSGCATQAATQQNESSLQCQSHPTRWTYWNSQFGCDSGRPGELRQYVQLPTAKSKKSTRKPKKRTATTSTAPSTLPMTAPIINESQNPSAIRPYKVLCTFARFGSNGVGCIRPPPASPTHLMSATKNGRWSFPTLR